MLTDVQKNIARSMWRYLPKLSSASWTKAVTTIEASEAIASLKILSIFLK